MVVSNEGAVTPWVGPQHFDEVKAVFVETMKVGGGLDQLVERRGIKRGVQY